MTEILKAEDTTDLTPFIDENIENALLFSFMAQGNIAMVCRQKGEATFRKRVDLKYNIHSCTIESKNVARNPGFETRAKFDQEIDLLDIYKICTIKKGCMVKLARVETTLTLRGMIDETDKAKSYRHTIKANTVVVELTSATSAIRMFVYPNIDNDLSSNYIKANHERIEQLCDKKLNSLSEVLLFIKTEVNDDVLNLSLEGPILNYYGLTDDDNDEEAIMVREEVTKNYGNLLSPVVEKMAKICLNSIV